MDSGNMSLGETANYFYKNTAVYVLGNGKIFHFYWS